MSLMDLSLEAFKYEYLIPALEQFMIIDIISTDCSLLNPRPWEVVYSIRIAMHLRDTMKSFEKDGFRIDCEYNKQAGLEKCNHGATSHKYMRPDFIIHKRTYRDGDSTKGNFLYCETKVHKVSVNDKEKIKVAIENYEYKFGLSISNITDKGIRLEWFEKDSPPKTENYIYQNLKLEISI